MVRIIQIPILNTLVSTFIIPSWFSITTITSHRICMKGWDSQKPRRFRHIFLDAEGTIYVPRAGRSRWEFWANPSPEAAVDFFELDSGVKEALGTLRERADTMCIVSWNTKPILDAMLDKHGLRGFFDDVLLNGDKGRRIKSYLRKHGLRPEDSVMVGDTPVLDLYPVRREGIDAVLVDRDYNKFARAERIKGVGDLPGWLKSADLDMMLSQGGARNATLDEYT